jgi:hypothetical protein
VQQDLRVRKEHKALLARLGRADFKERLVCLSREAPVPPVRQARLDPGETKERRVCPSQEAPVPPVRQARLDPREIKEPQAWEQQV